jgi:hypothetical protein
VRVRTRTYLVEDVENNGPGSPSTMVSLGCIDDDAQDDKLDVIWDLELDREILDKDVWKSIGRKGFDDIRFSAPTCTPCAGVASPPVIHDCVGALPDGLNNSSAKYLPCSSSEV